MKELGLCGKFLKTLYWFSNNTSKAKIREFYISKVKVKYTSQKPFLRVKIIILSHLKEPILIIHFLFEIPFNIFKQNSNKDSC